jgi:RsiW-degrading membrane proteinase PrsW (M82 family)
MDQATFQAQFPILVHDIFRDPFEAFLGLVAVPALFYVIPLLFILLIRWIWRGFSQDSPKKAEQGAAANP